MCAGLVDDLGDHVVQCGVGRFATSVAVSQGECSPLSMCRQNAPAVDLPQSLYLSLRQSDKHRNKGGRHEDIRRGIDA